MQDFIATYGLWLLIALVVILVLFFMLRGKANERTDISVAPPAESARTEPVRAEPVVPTPSPAPAPAVEKAIAPAPGEPDNLLQIKGIGPKVNTLLIGLGITRFEQIAGWTDADLVRIDSHLGTFSGRPTRDHWIDQASFLARGDIAGFEAKYGKL
ncbi:hypothetical protein [Rhizorhapis sp. SPR117]|uniref:hypothetical protein n=1 Tax=Rhizorhapis sp. SPR117 TaxID=2912611 RepID=UPI001F2EFD87|nr:hypothetical protein [Rhizorhapis sp. SPR117]